MQEAITVPVPEACRLLGLRRTTVFAMLRDRRLTRCKVGGRTLVTVASIKQLVADNLEGAG